jgi:hypothetical protein
VDYSACGMYYMLTINFTLLANNPTPPADKGVTAFCSSDAGGCSFTALHLPARIDNQIINFKDDSKTGQFRLLFSQTQQ